MNTDSLCAAIDFLRVFIRGRSDVHLGKKELIQLDQAVYYRDGSAFANFIEAHQPSLDELVILLIALVPHVQSQFFSRIIAEYFPEGTDFPEFGGVRMRDGRSFLATGETAQFILAGMDLEKRIEVQKLFSGSHWFAKKNILRLSRASEDEPVMSGIIVLDPEIVERLVTGEVTMPRFSSEFPAEHIETEFEWEDVVLPGTIISQLQEIENWIAHSGTLLNDWGMKRKIKPGYRALFCGPPGVGKTMTAILLGKSSMIHAKGDRHNKKKRDVFRIDLSRVVSKYIGETEKNLSRLFDKAENKDWILFFDEADALFGKRTGIRDAHDKYANQEVAYLLQRIESYNGLVILATNQRANIDDAFARRFQSIVQFSMPTPDERCQIWQKSFPSQITFSENVNWSHVAARYELSGSSILNIAQFCSISALADNSQEVDMMKIEAAIRREYVKDGVIV
jgi:SpoVK/Ycf46/Vps4 family AAA+-type ATPase